MFTSNPFAELMLFLAPTAMQFYVALMIAAVAFDTYIAFTGRLLFGSILWSKFAQMFCKPAAALQRRVEEANSSSSLPTPPHGRHSGQ